MVLPPPPVHSPPCARASCRPRPPTHQVSFGWASAADRRRCLALLHAVAAAVAATGSGEGGGGRGAGGAVIRGADAAVFPLPPRVAGRLLRVAADRIRARTVDVADGDGDGDAGAVVVTAGAGVEEGAVGEQQQGAGAGDGGRRLPRSLAAATIGPAVPGRGRRGLTVGYLRCAACKRTGSGLGVRARQRGVWERQHGPWRGEKGGALAWLWWRPAGWRRWRGRELVRYRATEQRVGLPGTRQAPP
jgi:hypothetical protein